MFPVCAFAQISGGDPVLYTDNAALVGVPTVVYSADGGADNNSCLGMSSVGGNAYILAPYTCAGGSGGTPGGNVNSIQYNNAGAFGGMLGVTTNGTAMIFGAGDMQINGAQSFNLNAAALPTAIAGTVLQLGSADTVAGRVEIDSFAAASNFAGRRSEGTAASPTATAAGSLITNLQGLGYTGSAFTTASSGSVRIYADSLWSGTSTPTHITFYNTPTGSLTSAAVAQIENDGGVTVPPTVTGGDCGAGCINATKIEQAGVALGSNAFTSTAYLPVANPSPTGTLTLPDSTTWTSSGLSALTVTGLASAGTQCVHVNTAGLLSGTGSDCGSGSGAVTSVTANANSTLTISPTTGAVVAGLNLGNANTWTAVQTFTNSDIRLLGSSTGYTTFTSANAGASNFTLTFPAVTDTVALLGTAQTFTAVQTFTNSDVRLLGSSTGYTTFTSANASATNYTMTVPAVTDTLMTLGAAQTVSGVITFSNGFTSNGNVSINNAVQLAFTSRTNAQISSPATSQLQFGGVDGTGANPITLSMVGVAAGNSNTASPNGTILGGLATGTPAGGSTTYGGDLIFKTTNVGAAATSRNTSSTALTLKGGTQTVLVGNAALSTSATDGFLYIPTVAGTPTGTPSSFTGLVPMVFDTTNSQFWFYTGGAWKQPKTPAGAALVTWQ